MVKGLEPVTLGRTRSGVGKGEPRDPAVCTVHAGLCLWSPTGEQEGQAAGKAASAGLRGRALGSKEAGNGLVSGPPPWS